MLADQVLTLTTLPPAHVEPSGPLKMKMINEMDVPLDPPVTLSSLSSSAVPEKDRKRKLSHRPNHPPMAILINEAITKLHERGGSSTQAIKKFISQSYHLDTGKLARYMRKYLREAVDSGILLHPKGKGATGHFKLAKKSKAKKTNVSKPVTKVSRKPHPKVTYRKKTTNGLRQKKKLTQKINV